MNPSQPTGPNNPGASPSKEASPIGTSHAVTRRDFIKLGAATVSGVALAGAKPAIDAVTGTGSKVEAAEPFGDSGVEMESGRRNRFAPDFRYSLFRPDKNSSGLSFGFFEADNLRGPLPIPEKTGMSALVEWDNTAGQYIPKAGLDEQTRSDLLNTSQVDVRHLSDNTDLLIIQGGSITTFFGGYTESSDKRRVIVTKKTAAGDWQVTETKDWAEVTSPDTPTSLYSGYYTIDHGRDGSAAIGMSVKKTADGKKGASAVWRIDYQTDKITKVFDSDYEVWENVQILDKKGALLVKARTLRDGKGWSKKVWDADWYDAQGNKIGERAPTHVLLVDTVNNTSREITQESEAGMLEDVVVGPDGAIYTMRRQTKNNDPRGTIKVSRIGDDELKDEKTILTVTPPDASVVKPDGGAFHYGAGTGLRFGIKSDGGTLVSFVGVYDGGVAPGNGNSVKIGMDVAFANLDATGNLQGASYQAHLSEQEISQWTSQVVEGEGRYGKRSAYDIFLHRIIPDPVTGDWWVKLGADTHWDGTFYDIFKLSPVKQ